MGDNEDPFDSGDFPLSGTYERNRVKYKFPVTILCLDERRFEFVYDKETTIRDLLQSVCHSLSIDHWQHFGLCLPIGKGHKFFPYSRSVKSSIDVDESNATLIPTASTKTGPKKKLYVSPILYLRLRLLEPINCLSNATLRKYYFQQLLSNVDQYRLMADECIFFRLAALILQKRFGDFRRKLLADQKYRESMNLLPHMIVNQQRRSSDCVTKCITQMHDFVKGLNAEQAEFQFIKACSLPPYDINFHLVPLSSHDRESVQEKWPKLRPPSLSIKMPNDESHKQVTRAKSLPRQLSIKFKRKLNSMDSEGFSRSINHTNVVTTTNNESHSKFRKYWLAIKPEGLQVYEEDKQGYLYSTASDLKWDVIDHVGAPNRQKLRVFMKGSDHPVDFFLSVLEYNSPSAKSLIWLIKDMRYQFFAAAINASQSMEAFETSDYVPFRERFVSDQQNDSSKLTSPTLGSAKVFETTISLRDHKKL